ncbi:hypothetical protein [Priestia megaterium]|uniref:hypothetical protein n=1 Tax=Priestia megaterium TaxID=1404 RepID=UPI00273057A3|nr:hypothetical protein [Priestia megaterium]MDP1443200.1 hypothetical protein [Priestia megaterium]MDP1472352.1 hypothetical protein [Priestia megaterium]
MEPKIRNVDLTAVKKIDEEARKPNQSRQQFSKNRVHTLAIFNQHSDREGHLKNLTEANSEMMNRFAISMKNLNDRLKELMRKYGDNE